MGWAKPQTILTGMSNCLTHHFCFLHMVWCALK
jgi:hypothetical protein